MDPRCKAQAASHDSGTTSAISDITSDLFILQLQVEKEDQGGDLFLDAPAFPTTNLQRMS